MQNYLVLGKLVELKRSFIESITPEYFKASQFSIAKAKEGDYAPFDSMPGLCFGKMPEDIGFGQKVGSDYKIVIRGYALPNKEIERNLVVRGELQDSNHLELGKMSLIRINKDQQILGVFLGNEAENIDRIVDSLVNKDKIKQKIMDYGFECRYDDVCLYRIFK